MENTETDNDDSVRPARVRTPTLAETLWPARGASTSEDHGQDNTWAAERTTTAQLNRDALVAVVAETGMALPAATWAQWRPTVRTRGQIVGVVEGVTCVATDGILGIFVFDRGQAHPTLGTAFKGHVASFTWDEERKLKVPVKDEVTGEERTTTVTQRRGTPPTLFSTPKATASTAGATGGTKPRKPKVDKVAKHLKELEALGL